MERDDIELIQSILSGDEDAFSDLFRKYQKRIHAFVWQKIGDYHIAEEITQDTFLQAHKKLASLKNPSKFAGWLYVIADRLCTAWLRKKKLAMQSLETVSVEALEKTAYANYIAEQREETSAEYHREIVDGLLEMLPESERTVIILHYLGEMSCEAIGKFLSVSPNTVKSRLQRGRNRLRISVDIKTLPDMLDQIRNSTFSDRNKNLSLPKGSKTMENNITQDSTQWNLPEDAKARLGKGKIHELQYSPDGSILAVASSIGIWLYDMKTYKEIFLFTEHRHEVSSVAFSPDGYTIASGSMDGTILLWDRKTSSYKRVIEPMDKTLSSFTIRAPGLSFSPDGKTLACGYQNTVHICDAITGELKNTIIKESSGIIKNLAFSPDGETIYCSNIYGEISLWNVLTGKHKQTIQEPTNYEHSIAFNPIGNTFAVSNVIVDQDCSISVNVLNTGEPKFKLTEHSGAVYYLAFNPNGDTLASSSYGENKIRLWNAHTGEEKLTLSGHKSDFYSLAFSPDGKTVVSGSEDGVIRFWDTNTGDQEYNTFTEHNGFIEDFAFTSNGKTVTSAYAYGTIRVWDTNTGQLIKTDNEFRDPMLKGEIQNLNCIPDGKILAWGDGGESGEYCMHLWDANTGERKMLPAKYEWNNHSLKLSPVGNMLAIALDDNLLRLCDMFTGEEKFVLSSHSKDIFAIAFSPDSKSVAITSSEDNTIPVWDTDTGEIKNLLDLDSALRNDIVDWRIDSSWCGLAFSPDGQTLAIGGGEIILLWDIGTAQTKMRITKPTHRVFDLAFSPDGKTLASGGFESNINLWDAQTGEHKKTLTGHTAWVRSVAFSPDGKFLGSRSDDGTVLIWKVDP
ncbi:MAG: sigma-70 family RNA polymerase sigma factor [Candidatus Poribacteria bacterium]|nr:sigma-70 family RNA polymerase sigma factor [Candidatus Poribacteria bacterium]